jgi:hypothetical protein
VLLTQNNNKKVYFLKFKNCKKPPEISTTTPEKNNRTTHTTIKCKIHNQILIKNKNKNFRTNQERGKSSKTRKTTKNTYL